MANAPFIEKRSIDYVPCAERHGKVWHLWPVWFSGDANLATGSAAVHEFLHAATAAALSPAIARA